MPDGQMPREEREPTYSDVVGGEFNPDTGEWVKEREEGTPQIKGMEVVPISGDDLLRAQINTEVDEQNRPKFATSEAVDAEFDRRKAEMARATTRPTETTPQEEKVIEGEIVREIPQVNYYSGIRLDLETARKGYRGLDEQGMNAARRRLENAGFEFDTNGGPIDPEDVEHMTSEQVREKIEEQQRRGGKRREVGEEVERDEGVGTSEGQDVRADHRERVVERKEKIEAVLTSFFIEQVSQTLSSGSFDSGGLARRFDEFWRTRNLGELSEEERLELVEAVRGVLLMVSEVKRMEKQSPDNSFERKKELMSNRSWVGFDYTSLSALESMRNGDVLNFGRDLRRVIVDSFGKYNKIGFGLETVNVAGVEMGWEALASEMRNPNLEIAVAESIGRALAGSLSIKGRQGEIISELGSEIAMKLWSNVFEMGEISYRYAQDRGVVGEKKPPKSTVLKLTTYENDKTRPTWLDKSILKKIGESPAWFLCDAQRRSEVSGLVSYAMESNFMEVNWGDPLMQNPFDQSDRSFFDGAGIVDLALRVQTEPDKLQRIDFYKGLVKPLVDLYRLGIITGDEGNKAILSFSLGHLTELKLLKERQGEPFDKLDVQNAVTKILKGAEKRGEETIYVLPTELYGEFDRLFPEFLRVVEDYSKRREAQMRGDATIRTLKAAPEVALRGILQGILGDAFKSSK